MQSDYMDKWEMLGYLFAVINPMLPGILMGFALWTDKKYKKTGRNVIVLSVVMTVLWVAFAVLVVGSVVGVR
jgi:hypothetical protein